MSPPAVKPSPAPVSTTTRTLVVAPELLETLRELVARRHRDAVQLPGTSSVIVATVTVALESEAVELGHAVAVLSRGPAKDLPRRALRQRGDEAVLARPLEARKRVRGEAVGVELLLRRRRRRRRRRRGVPAGRRARRPRRPRRRRVAREHVLDLERVDVLAAGDDHVVDAAVDPEVAVLVDPADVAGAVPAVANRLRVRVGPVPVAAESLVGARWHADLVVVAERSRALRAAGPHSPASRSGRGAMEKV